MRYILFTLLILATASIPTTPGCAEENKLKPITIFVLKECDDRALVTAVWDPSTKTVNIPCLVVDGICFWADFTLVDTENLMFKLVRYGKWE